MVRGDRPRTVPSPHLDLREPRRSLPEPAKRSRGKPRLSGARRSGLRPDTSSRRTARSSAGIPRGRRSARLRAVALRVKQHIVAVPGRTVVREQRFADVARRTGRLEIPGRGRNRVSRVQDVLHPVAVAVDTEPGPCARHELHRATGTSRRRVPVTPMPRLGHANTGQQLPRDAILLPCLLVEGLHIRGYRQRLVDKRILPRRPRRGEPTVARHAPAAVRIVRGQRTGRYRVSPSRRTRGRDEHRPAAAATGRRDEARDNNGSDTQRGSSAAHAPSPTVWVGDANSFGPGAVIDGSWPPSTSHDSSPVTIHPWPERTSVGPTVEPSE